MGGACCMLCNEERVSTTCRIWSIGNFVGRATWVMRPPIGPELNPCSARRMEIGDHKSRLTLATSSELLVTLIQACLTNLSLNR